MALSTETRGWFGTTQDPPSQPTTPEDPVKAQIRALIAAGKSDDEIRKALEPRSALDKAGAVVKGTVKGLTDPLQLGAIKEAVQALPDIGRRIVSPEETRFMGVPIGTATDIAKGSGTALVQLGALPYTLGRAIGDALPVSLGGKPEVKGSSALAQIDPAAQTSDPWEAYSRRIGNIVALIAAPELIRKARAGAGGGPRPPVPFGAEPTAPGSVPTSTRPITSTPALRGVATVPPTAGRPLTTAPWLRMNVPGEAAREGGGVVPPGPGGGPVPGPAAPRPLGLPVPATRTPPPPGTRLVKNPPNPIVEAARQAVEEAQAPVRGGVELPGEPPQPRVTHPSESQVKALVKAAEARKVKEAAARAAQAAKAGQGTPQAAGGGTGTGTSTVPSTVPSSTVPPPTTLQKIEEVLGDQRGEVDLTGEKGIPPEGGGKLVPAGGEPRGPATMPTEPERRLAAAQDFITEWEQGGPTRAALLDRPLTPEQRTSLKMAVAARPGELLDLRNALGMAEHPAPLGFQPSPTTSLSEMVAKYGKEGAARRAGMKVSELEARIEAGGDPQKLEQLLRQREGAAETNRRLGTAGPSTGRLPDNATLRVKASIERSKAAGEPISAKDKAFADRWHGENPDKPTLYSGIDPTALWKVAKKHPALFGTAAGGTLGALVGSGGNENEQLGGAVLGAGSGALLGATLANPARALEAALNVTSNSMLSGGAIAKNLVTLGGGTVRSAVENQTPAQGRLGALKQVISPSKLGANRRAYWQGTKNINPRTSPLTTNPGRIPPKWQRLVLPANIIGGIDEMGTQAFRRAGMSERDIERNLLTAHRNIIRGGLQRDLSKLPLRPGELDDRDLDALARIMVRFQRVPTNIIAEGGKEGIHLLKHPFTARSAYNAAQAGASYWAGKKAKESPRNRLLALIALAAAGPNTGLSTLAMAGGFGGQSLRALGGLTPVPEFEPPSSLKSLGRNLGLPPAAVTAYQHLVENK